MTDRSVIIKMSARIVDKKEKQELIIRAAIKLFARKGFARTTISDIAREAGIAKGTVYDYFDTKDNIIQNSFFFFIKELEFDFESILLSPVPAIEKLRQVFSAFSRTMQIEANQQLLELMFDFWAESVKSTETKTRMFKEMDVFYQAYRKLCRDLILDGIREGSFREDLDAETMAVIILGMNDGIMVQWLLDKSIDFEKTMKEMVDMVLKGITSPAGNKEQSK
jgi:TetR/AcrR family fatty acid metabolism transcriptional regulator